jgi:hypothetical protein
MNACECLYRSVGSYMYLCLVRGALLVSASSNLDRTQRNSQSLAASRARKSCATPAQTPQTLRTTALVPPKRVSSDRDKGLIKLRAPPIGFGKKEALSMIARVAQSHTYTVTKTRATPRAPGRGGEAGVVACAVEADTTAPRPPGPVTLLFLAPYSPTAQLSIHPPCPRTRDSRSPHAETPLPLRNSLIFSVMSARIGLYTFTSPLSLSLSET